MPAIFVYGSLKNSKTFQSVTGMHFPDKLLATTKGKMVLYENFPIAFPDTDREMKGLVLEVPYEIIQAIDTYEEEGRLCIRQEIKVTTANGEESAFIYWGNPAHPAFYHIENYQVIDDGNWIKDEEMAYNLK